jgi:hypothetical protein
MLGGSGYKKTSFPEMRAKRSAATRVFKHTDFFVELKEKRCKNVLEKIVLYEGFSRCLLDYPNVQNVRGSLIL